MSQRLKTNLRATELLVRSGEVELTLARFGGDGFIVLCEELGSQDDAVRVAERVQKALLSPFVLDGTEQVVTANIGIALADWRHRDTEDLLRDAEDLLRDADIAMYRAKATGEASSRQASSSPIAEGSALILEIGA